MPAASGVQERGPGMELSTWRRRAVGVCAAIVVGLAISACANNPRPDDLASKNGPAPPGSARDFAINTGDLVYFSTDSVDLTTEAQQTLANQARWLQKYSQYTITIEGHADERGTREYNIALGAKRAQTVRDYLAKNGVNAGRIRTVSYGKERPVAVCNDISCWSQNRRSQTVLNSRQEARS